MIDVDAARALVADAALWPRVRDFLWDFAPQVHGSWLEDLGRATLDEGLMSSPRVKRFILSALGIEPCFHAFPKDDWSRLALLDGQALELIVKWLGALACAGELRRVTDGKTVRALKSALPGIYPEVFGYTAYFARIDSQRRGAETQGEESPDAGSRPSIAENVVSAGLSVVDSLLADVPSPILSRFRFKLPKSLCDSAAPRLKKETCGAVVAKLLKLKFPEAYRLCC